MKILLSIHHKLDPDSGAPGCTLKLGSQFKSMGHDVRFYSFDNLPSILGNRLTKALFPFFLAVRLFFLVRKNNIDIIDTSTGDGWVWAVLAPILFSKRPLFVTRSHGLEHMVDKMLQQEAAKGMVKLTLKYRFTYRLVRLNLIRLTLRKADLVLMLNRQELDFAIEKLGVNPKQAFVISHGINRNFLNLPFTPLNKADRNLQIALIGSFIPIKGINYSIPALSRILEQYSFIEVHFFGTGHKEKTVYSRFESSLHKKIRVTPQYNQQELPSLLEGSHIVLFPSLSEGFGLSLLEAMACSLAPVASSVGGPSEFIKDGENGLLIEPGSSDQIESALQKLITDNNLLEKIRINAQKSAQGYTWEKSAEEQIALYRKHL